MVLKNRLVKVPASCSSHQRSTWGGWLSLAVVAALSVAPLSTAHATNGYFSSGYGTINKSLAGAGVAVAQDTMAGAINPANMVHLGARMDLGLAIFNPNRGFTADNNASVGAASIPVGEYESEDLLFFIPHFGYNKPIDANSSIGISVGANGGMSVNYNDNVFRNFGATATAPTSSQLEQLFMGISYARKINERLSVGVMPILAVQRYEAKGLEPFKGVSASPNNVTNNGMDYSYGGGVKVGVQGWITEDVALGASYQSRLYMTRFKKYEGLFAEQGDFDVPPNLIVGAAWKMTPKVTALFDFQRFFYNDVKAIANSNALPIAGVVLGTDDGMGFGWVDMDIYKLGLEWRYAEDLTLRAGYNHSNQVVPSSQALFNILAPATVRDHAALGFTKVLGEKNAIDVSFTHAFNESVSGSNINTGTQTGKIEMNQNELTLNWSHRF